MDAMVLLAALLAGAAVLMISYGAWSVVGNERQRVSWRVSRTGISTHQNARGVAELRPQDRQHAVFAPVDRALSKYSWAENSRRQLERAEIRLHVSEFIAIRVLTTAAVLVVALFFAIRQDELLIALGGGLAGLFMWWQFGAWVRRRIDRRRSELEAHLDEALLNLSGSLRAGFSFVQACQMAVPQLSWPLQSEIRDMIEDINVGASLDDALRHLAERVESYEMDITVNAVLVQRQVGGSLAEVLDNIAFTIRERRELQGHVMALTAEQRLSAYLVAGVPVFMLALLCITSWQFMKPLFVTTTGNILMAVGVILDVLGFLVMRRLGKIDY